MATKQDIKTILERLQHDGKLNPEAVVREAENPTSPLHLHFEWDVSVAAHKFRLIQAEALIKRIKLRIRHQTEKTVIPVYIRDPTATGPGYIHLTRGDLALNDAYASLDAEIARIRGNYSRGFGIAALLDRKHPGLLDYFITHCSEILPARAVARPGPSPKRNDKPSTAPDANPDAP